MPPARLRFTISFPKTAHPKIRPRTASSCQSSPSTVAASSGCATTSPAIRNLLQFVRICAAEFGLKGRWGFQYANSCSQPRVDAFGGGAHVVDLNTGKTIAWTYTDGWLARVLGGGDPDE